LYGQTYNWYYIDDEQKKMSEEILQGILAGEEKDINACHPDKEKARPGPNPLTALQRYCNGLRESNRLRDGNIWGTGDLKPQKNYLLRREEMTKWIEHGGDPLLPIPPLKGADANLEFFKKMLDEDVATMQKDIQTLQQRSSLLQTTLFQISDQELKAQLAFQAKQANEIAKIHAKAALDQADAQQRVAMYAQMSAVAQQRGANAQDRAAEAQGALATLANKAAQKKHQPTQQQGEQGGKGGGIEARFGRAVAGIIHGEVATRDPDPSRKPSGSPSNRRNTGRKAWRAVQQKKKEQQHVVETGLRQRRRARKQNVVDGGGKRRKTRKRKKQNKHTRRSGGKRKVRKRKRSKKHTRRKK